MGKRSISPAETLLRLDRMPLEWCPGCGIGIVVNTLLRTVGRMGGPEADTRLVLSGISCAGKIPDYVRLPCEESDPGEIFRTALRLRRDRPGSRVVVIVSDNDLIVSGGDGLAELLSSGESVVVLYLNSFVAQLLIEHRGFSTLPFLHQAPNRDPAGPFNIPRTADLYGAAYVARWTPLHCRRFAFSLKKALKKSGPALIEIIVPCLMYFASELGGGTTLDRMGLYLERAVIRNRESTENLYMRREGEIVIGTFIDR
jgi:2-oxoglutarate ferredoxin oxidoreductase subunit beta